MHNENLEAAYLAGLNPEQRAAVLHHCGPALVLAGAGSGKTRVLTTRIAHLVKHHGVRTGQIMAVTFTNKAAKEMRSRVERLLDQPPAGMWLGTFHGFGSRILRQHGAEIGVDPRFEIADKDTSLRMILRAMDRLNIDRREYIPQVFQSQISNAKNAMLISIPADTSRQSKDPYSRLAPAVYEAYQQLLSNERMLDYDDLLLRPALLLQASDEIRQRIASRFQFLLVDEYQDTNRSQFELLRLIAQEHKNIMVVGDDDQSIYGWRGADIQNVLDFERTFPGTKIMRLQENYRSTANIIDAANSVIRKNTRRMEKTLRTRNEPGDRISLSRHDNEWREAEWVAQRIERLRGYQGYGLRDISCLYRTNSQSRALEEALRMRGLAYAVVGAAAFYERREIKDVISYLRLVSNGHDSEAFQRAAGTPKRGLGEVTAGKVIDFAEANGISTVEAAERAAEIPGVGPKPRASLLEFAALVRRIGTLATLGTVSQVVETLIREARLLEELAREEDGQDRIENVRELVAGARHFDEEQRVLRLEAALSDDPFDANADLGLTPLDLFLEQAALIATADNHDPDHEAVTLMSLHAAKGLEFPVVFLCGVEQDLLPHVNSNGKPEAVEEERRLFYVGITRAKHQLEITYSDARRRGGTIVYNAASPFLQDLPAHAVESVDARSGARQQEHRPYARQPRFGAFRR
jgi:DNA helicase II / ATP-dependent DNA helicase PcrA